MAREARRLGGGRVVRDGAAGTGRGVRVRLLVQPPGAPGV
jgi:hypothetical protein